MLISTRENLKIAIKLLYIKYFTQRNNKSAITCYAEDRNADLDWRLLYRQLSVLPARTLSPLSTLHSAWFSF